MHCPLHCSEFGYYSPEINAVMQTAFVSLFAGVIYGGIKASKDAYVDFIERNQATIYENIFDAKVTVIFTVQNNKLFV